MGRNHFRDLSNLFLDDLSGDRQLQVYRRLARREAFPHSRLDGLYRSLRLRQQGQPARHVAATPAQIS